ncbi:MAG: rhodanese-like domain-containing protein [Saccharofermentanales bacterium]
MKRILTLCLTFMLYLSVLAGCSLVTTEKTGNSTLQNTYEQITPEEAKYIMDNEDSYIILDVRTQDEYDAEHIKGAILIPDYEIETTAESILTDKDALILVYCRSGRRSKNAASELSALGYTNVKEFGGIIDWQYDTVTE